MWPDGDECAKLGHLVHGEEEDRRDGHPSGRAIPRKSLILLVRMKGLEPSHPCEYMDLNHARLPIPPRWQVNLHCSGDLSSPCQEDLHVYSTDVNCGVKQAVGRVH